MNEQNENLVKRWHDEGINQQNADLALELCAENFQFHFAFITSDYPIGSAALRHWAKATFEFFPDFHVTLLDMVSDDDLAAGAIYPSLTRIREISLAIAEEIVKTAQASGLAHAPTSAMTRSALESSMYDPSY